MKLPYFEGDAFCCPHCDAFSKQRWRNFLDASRYSLGVIATCDQCGLSSIWIDERMVYPRVVLCPKHHSLLPDNCIPFYNEARLVASDSPRAAAALLRLTIETLILELGVKEKNLNNAIGELVAQGLPPAVQKAWDACRVIGNEAVHTGEILGDDTEETTKTLFWLVNFIVAKMIEDPQRIEEMYGILPEGKRAGIEQRDRNATS